MRLRIRCLGNKETMKIELPDDCSLQQFKETISMKLSASSFPPSSLHVSLNGKDELSSSSSEDCLSSLGITTGDLIYYSLDPSISPQNETNPSETLISESRNETVSSLQDSPNKDQDNNNSQTFEASKQIYGCDFTFSDSNFSETLIPGRAASNENAGNREKESVSGFDCKHLALPRVFCEILKERGKSVVNCKLLACAVHGILLDSGFAAIDPLSGAELASFQFPSLYSSTSSCITVWYSIPDLLNTGSSPTDAVVVKYQSLGKFVTVYGSLPRNDSALHRICLDEERLGPCLTSVLDTLLYGGSIGSLSENEVLEFFKIVKDGLVFRLVVDLCEGAAIVPPPCLKWLPTELKFKILELLPGTDIAKVACVSSEFRCLSSNNDLWKQKFREEFGNGEMEEETVNWKNRFALSWEDSKRRKRQIGWTGRSLPYVSRFPRPNLGTFLFRTPRIIGGTYDWQPGGGAVPMPFRLGGSGFTSMSMRQSFSPNCNLGGFDG